MSNVLPSAAPLISERRAIAVPPDRWFFGGMAVAAALVVFAGFAPSYYLKGLYGSPPLSPLRHLHGAVFTLWMVLFVVQTSLIAARRTSVHRRLGIAGVLLAATMVVVGTAVAIAAAKYPRAVAPGLPPPLVFLVIPLSDLAGFLALVTLGVFKRRQPDVHKRLMLLATIAILPAALGRLVFPGGLLDVLGLPAGPLTLTGLTAMFVGACVVHDRLSRGRVHPASLWGGAFLLTMQVLRLFVGGTAAWLTFARWLTS
jgi:hypothetical protein